MTHLLGTDEAGYGPNLGPLVVTGTLWRIPDAVPGDALYRHLPSIRSSPAHAAGSSTAVVIGDSKTLYKPGAGLAALEQVALAALRLTDGLEAAGGSWPTWREILTRCDPSCAEPLEQNPWYSTFDGPLPRDATVDTVRDTQTQLAAALDAADVQLLAIQSQIVCPAKFNDRVASCGNKASALSFWTLELVERMTASIEAGAIEIQCDKHGGRNRYGPLLQQVFPEYLIEVRQESKAQSVYRWGPATRRIEARFVAKGEQFLPTALASMISKYLRELAMLAFNTYWTGCVPGLRPTAGYPEDARRFRREIRDAQQGHGIPDAMLWRER